MGSSKHVLVVEDDDGIRDLLKQTLSDAKYSVSTASRAAQGLEEMLERTPDLLVLDLMMPDMNGWELLERMARSPELAAVPVLVVSAASSDRLKDAQQLGAPVFLAKPFEIDDLLAEVQRLTSRPVRQCAWCGLVANAEGDFGLHSGRRLSWATHGVCPQCKRGQMERILRESA